MGIRCTCPNGHPLHLKSLLGGKRGICPRCNTGFRIPLESEFPDKPQRFRGVDEPIEEQAAEIGSTSSSGRIRIGESGEMSNALVRPSRSTGMADRANDNRFDASSNDGQDEMASDDVSRKNSAPAENAATPVVPKIAASNSQAILMDPITESPDAVWYVRPPAGGQYGPATGDILQKWMQEGRVSSDSHVWRNGWDDWQRAGELFPDLPPSHMASLVRNPNKPDRSGDTLLLAGGQKHRLAKSQRNSSLAIGFVVLLSVLSISLLIGLAYLIREM